MTLRSLFVAYLFLVLCGLLFPVAVAVAPEDAPALVIEPPSDHPGTSEKAAPQPSPTAAEPLPSFPVWMTVIGILFVALAMGGILLLRRPKKYVPRAKRLQK